MESNGMPGQAGGMYSSMGSSGMLGLEMSLQHNHIPQTQQQNPQNPHHHMQQHQHQHQHHPIPMGLSYANQQQQDQMASKQGYPFVTKPKNPPLTLSDDDESNGLATENSADDGKTKATSPWHRMKWTDNMVRLLIMVVYYIGDEAGSDGTNDPGAGKKKGGGSSGGVLQKKGKWKSVSRAMMERGFYVSPQQCEDKFNDLNKRYKRVNDILGKGTACRVVENQNLLETMDHLSPKIKEEVKKLLNSKHLFFREMCAYHNSCGHGGGGPQQSPEASSQGQRQQPPPQQPQPQPQPRCLHSTDQNGSNLVRGEVEVSKLGKRGEEDEDNYEDDNEDDEDDKEDEDDEEVVEGGGGDDDDDDNETDERRFSRKRLKKGVVFVSPLIQQLNLELKNVFQDESKSALEKRQWMRGRMLQLEEQHVGYEYAAFQLEKQRLKWLKFRNKKEREMEREKISNERMKLENERMSLLIRQKELELIDQYQQSSRKSDPSSITG